MIVRPSVVHLPTESARTEAPPTTSQLSTEFTPRPRLFRLGICVNSLQQELYDILDLLPELAMLERSLDNFQEHIEPRINSLAVTSPTFVDSLESEMDSMRLMVVEIHERLESKPLRGFDWNTPSRSSLRRELLADLGRLPYSLEKAFSRFQDRPEYVILHGKDMCKVG